MSLLNDMLRDLSVAQKPVEKTSGAQAAELDLQAYEQRELLQQSSVVKPLPGNLLPSILVFVIVLALLLLWQKNFLLPVAQPAPDNGIINKETINKKIVDQEIVDNLAADKPAGNSTAAISSPVALPDDNQTPRVDSKPATVDAVLDERLVALESAISRLSTAVEKSTAIEEANVAMSYVAAELHDQTGEADVSPPATESERIQDPFIPASINESMTAAIDTPVAPQPETDVASESIPADAHLSIAPNPVAVDKREAEKAQALLAQGQEASAITGLQLFIAKAKAPRESARVLLDIFSAQGNILAMNEFLATANYLSPIDKSFYAAKVAVIQQREADAIQLLETHLADAENQENYQALLAGLYQRAGQFQAATTLYRRLLASVGDKPAYWLGFALAQDSLNQAQTAKQAYLHLAGYADLQPQVRTYIEQRLAALQ